MQTLLKEGEDFHGNCRLIVYAKTVFTLGKIYIRLGRKKVPCSNKVVTCRYPIFLTGGYVQKRAVKCLVTNLAQNLIAAATTAPDSAAAGGGFAGGKNMLSHGRRQEIPVRAHRVVGQRGALPRLDTHKF